MTSKEDRDREARAFAAKMWERAMKTGKVDFGRNWTPMDQQAHAEGVAAQKLRGYRPRPGWIEGLLAGEGADDDDT